MPIPPKTGTQQTRNFTVAREHTIEFEGLPPVLSTPALIWFLEHSAIDLMTPFLPPGRITVGTEIELQHTGPAQIGDAIRCEAVVVHGTDRNITFRVQAFNGQERIAQGLHRRAVVSRDRLRRKLEH